MVGTTNCCSCCLMPLLSSKSRWRLCWRHTHMGVGVAQDATAPLSIKRCLNGKVQAQCIEGTQITVYTAAHSFILIHVYVYTRRKAFVSQALRACRCCGHLWPYLHQLLCLLQEWVFAEVARVLAPSGACIVSFSTHCWPDKATAAWLQRTLGQRLKLISK